MIDQSEFERAKFKAIKYLGISQKTEFEVYIKLINLEFDKSIIYEVIKYLKNLNYIDDINYVNSFIIQNERFLKYSLFEIKQKLRDKGIDTQLIEAKLEDLASLGYEKKVVKKLLDSKLKNYEEIRMKQYLYRRGFKI